MSAPFSPPSSAQSLDASSPVFPDRPIRPLPKRRIRSRLSAEAAESLLSKPAKQTTAPLFYYPFPFGREVDSNHAAGNEAQGPKSDIRVYSDARVGNGHVDGDFDSESHDDSNARRGRGHRFDEADARDAYAAQQRHEQSLGKGQFVKPGFSASAASSADGYDSFENTNNKKKRKIPTPGAGSGNQSHLSAELANMGLSSRDSLSGGSDEHSNGVGQYYASGTAALPGSGTGISGPGRGRYGRSGANRSGHSKLPLAVSSDGLNSGRAGGARRTSGWGPEGTAPAYRDSQNGNGPGIISAAMAASERAPPLSQGQENVSLLQQQQHSASKTRTQFTFTSTDVAWPGASQNMPPMPSHGQSTASYKAHQDMMRAGSQTSPGLPGGNGGAAQGSGPVHDNPTPRKPRRTSAKEYELAARHRKLQQEYNNFQKPPRKEDIYICAFCEYTSIFGTPPMALIRRYEEKDLAERRRLEEKRRLLEKAKANARKGKKGKGAAKNSVANQQARQQQSQQQAGAGDVDAHQQQQSPVDGEDYYDDDYDGEPLPPPPPSVASTNQSFSKTSKTGQQAPKAGGGGDGGGGGGGVNKTSPMAVSTAPSVAAR